jgi:hypothetical protein
VEALVVKVLQDKVMLEELQGLRHLFIHLVVVEAQELLDQALAVQMMLQDKMEE